MEILSKGVSMKRLLGSILFIAQRIQVERDIFADIGQFDKPAYIAFGNNDSLQGNY